MPDQTSTIISKVWGMCNPLRDNGVSYGDYLEQLTYLIFLKMSDEYSKPPYRRETGIPFGYTWADMNTLKGAELEEQYKATLEKLGEQGGILGKIFKGAVNKISSAAILYRIVQMIDQERWVSMSSDVKGEIYEGLLQKNAEDVKSGAGQYFTPRPLIRAMVRCVRPEPMKTIADESVPRLIQYNGTDIAKKPGNMGFLAEAAHGSLFLLPGNPLWSQSSMGTAGEDCMPY